jgi:hypothetical protein
MRHSLFNAAVAATLLIAAPAGAAGVTLDATDHGWYDDTGFHDTIEPNYFTGYCPASACGTDREYRSFHVFDLSSVTDTVLGAVFRPYEPSDPPDVADGWFSDDASETLAAFDVTTPVATVTAGGSGLTAIFADLGSGTSFGSVVTTMADNGSSLSVPLNAAGVAAINAAAGGSFALGGALTSLTSLTNREVIFAFTPGTVPNRLELTLNECGDGVVADAEDCDDGNTADDGNCCDASCQFVAPEGACSDGSMCTTDVCDGAGTCLSNPIVTTSCFAAPATKLKISDSATAGKDKLQWQWGKGAAFAQTDLGDPTNADSYSLCIFDETLATPSLVGQLDIAASATLWSDKDPKGLQYKDKAGTSDGVTKAQLKTGDADKTKIKVSAGTSNLALPAAFDAMSFFGQDTEVEVTLVNSAGKCWTSSFAAADTKFNTPEKFQAQTK